MLCDLGFTCCVDIHTADISFVWFHFVLLIYHCFCDVSIIYVMQSCWHCLCLGCQCVHAQGCHDMTFVKVMADVGSCVCVLNIALVFPNLCVWLMFDIYKMASSNDNGFLFSSYGPYPGA